MWLRGTDPADYLAVGWDLSCRHRQRSKKRKDTGPGRMARPRTRVTRSPVMNVSAHKSHISLGR